MSPFADLPLDQVIAVAEAAARDILDVYAGQFEVQHKADTSPVTAADMAAHRRIVHRLTRLTPQIPVLSEESAESVPAAVRQRWARYWLVDPLDGTREFIKRNGEFTVNIALVEDGVAVYGLIQAPVLDMLWHGGPGQGAWRRDNAGEHRLYTCRPAACPLRVASSRSWPSPWVETLRQRGDDAVAVPLGSSLKFCRLAEGQLDIYPRFGPTSEWDTAAGQAIVEGAGGAVLDLTGKPLRYNQRAGLLNGDFVAIGDPALPWADLFAGSASAGT